MPESSIESYAKRSSVKLNEKKGIETTGVISSPLQYLDIPIMYEKCEEE